MAKKYNAKYGLYGKPYYFNSFEDYHNYPYNDGFIVCTSVTFQLGDFMLRLWETAIEDADEDGPNASWNRYLEIQAPNMYPYDFLGLCYSNDIYDLSEISGAIDITGMLSKETIEKISNAFGDLHMAF